MIKIKFEQHQLREKQLTFYFILFLIILVNR